MLIIFDWDGTLMDSTQKIITSMQLAAEECGLSVLESDVVKNIIGLGLPEAIHHLYPSVNAHSRGKLQQAYAKFYVDADRVPCEFFVGVEECLASLQLKGHKIAVATGKSRKGLHRVLSNINWLDKFDASRCADETASKPHPKMLFELMDELDFSKEETIMIGDTEYDLEMANNAQIKSIGVSYGAHARERLYKHSPIAVIDSVLELHDFIQ
jgi:phosphoglycolate phosphatase